MYDRAAPTLESPPCPPPIPARPAVLRGRADRFALPMVPAPVAPVDPPVPAAPLVPVGRVDPAGRADLVGRVDLVGPPAPVRPAVPAGRRGPMLRPETLAHRLPAPTTAASGCRRCSPRPASAVVAPARS